MSMPVVGAVGCSNGSDVDLKVSNHFLSGVRAIEERRKREERERAKVVPKRRYRKRIDQERDQRQICLRNFDWWCKGRIEILQRKLQRSVHHHDVVVKSEWQDHFELLATAEIERRG